MSTIIMTGNKVTLRLVEEKDLPILHNLMHGESSDKEWRKYNGPYFPFPEETYDEFEKDWLPRITSPQKPNPNAIIEVNGTIVGMMFWYWESEATRWMEMGIVIYSSQYWSGGFGTEALTLWTEYLFNHLEVERVGITTWSGNPRMMKCAEKIGMQLEGRMRKCRYYQGEYYDSIKMGILREEWERFKEKR